MIQNLSWSILLQATVCGLLMGLVYSLVAAGLTMIYGLMDFVNFAHGEFLMLAMYFAFWAHALFGMDPLVSLPGVIVILFGLGILTYLLIVRRLLKTAMVTQMFATFGLSVFLRSLAQFLWGPDYRMVQDPVCEGSFHTLGLHIGRPQVVAGFVALLCFAGLYWMMHRTRLGRAMRATAQDRMAAEVKGIDTQMINVLGWGISIALVGVAGTLLTNYTYVGPYIGASFAALSFVAVALGGFGSVEGALLGSLIAGVVEALSGLFIPSGLKLAAVFVLYVLVVLWRPKGLMGRY